MQANVNTLILGTNVPKRVRSIVVEYVVFVILVTWSLRKIDSRLLGKNLVQNLKLGAGTTFFIDFRANWIEMFVNNVTRN